MDRRLFLEFMGRSAALSLLASQLSSCGSASKVKESSIPSIDPTDADDVILAKGLRSKVLIKWQDPITQQGDLFGINNDFLAFPKVSNLPSNEALLWVNHEATIPLFVSGYMEGKSKRTKTQVDQEQLSVGGSFVKIRKDPLGSWEFVPNDPLNRRITAKTKIPLISQRPIRGKTTAIGTLGNCAGGQTPWGTILTCEENYQDFYGEYIYDGKKSKFVPSDLQWEKFYPYPSEHYGWVVEVDPLTGESKKLTALGRFAHESATVIQAKDGRCVVYSGDDKADSCFYKFISSKPGSLEEGELFAADTINGRWLSLSIEKSPILKANFIDQTEVLIRAREAAAMIGATLLDRPEDVEQDPETKAMFLSLTNNRAKKNHHGSLLKIEEANRDPLSLSFKASTFLMGGTDSGFSCPDNLAFDSKGNLWMTSDISGAVMNRGEYAPFKNNGLFYIPMRGDNAGKIYQLASAPRDAEFTGPCFDPEGKNLFLSVQHPGEYSTSKESLSSHWPEGGESLPKSAVIQISGPLMNSLLA